MIIQQNCLFSFDEIIKFQPETKLELILSQLDLNNIIFKISKKYNSRGPKGYSARTLISSLIAMQVNKIKTFKDLVLNLKENPVLRYNCGFEVLGKVPSTSTFSRFLDKISSTTYLEEDFTEIVKKAITSKIIDGENIAIDSTQINSYEKAKPTSKLKNDSISANWGAKRDTNGNTIKWFGYKLHILSDCKSELPMSILISPANFHDGRLAAPLITKYKNTFNEINTSNYIMDSGYDYLSLYRFIIDEVKSNPIIAYNKRGTKAAPEGFNDSFEPICSMGYPLVYWGKDNNYLKYRCPHATGHINCPHGSNWCSKSNYGLTLKFNYKKDGRLHSYPPRASTEWQLLYNKRTSIERCNSRLKEQLNVNNIRCHGILKVKTIALLSCISLIAGTLAVNL